MTKPSSLQGHIAVVAGSTRGAGRGIARALGEAGATVYCTGRSTRGDASAYGRPETIEETAALVTAAGGRGIAIRVDHTVEDEVRALFERIQKDHGQLDVLVDGIAGEDPRFGGWTSFWKTSMEHAAEVIRHALVSHIVTARHAAPLMIARRRGLIVEVTEGDLLFGGGNILSDVVKTGLKGLAVRMAEELRPHKVAAVAVTPGYLRSETMLEHFGVTEETWRKGGKKDPSFLESETPLFLGRGVAALAKDRKVFAKSGQILSSWGLAREYGFTDADGSRPDWGRHWQTILPVIPGMRQSHERLAAWLDQLSARVRSYAS